MSDSHFSPVYCDEVENANLAFAMKRRPWDDWTQELQRVRATISAHTMSGADLSYWHERERILKAGLGQ